MGAVNRTRPYGRTVWRGHRMDNRTVSALLWAERGYRKKAPSRLRPWVIAQGSYNPGGVGVSGGTHDGGGAVDISVSGMTRGQIRRAVRWLRRAGFAAWFRPQVPGVWGPHIHAILRGHRTASAQAKGQQYAYDVGRDGLAGNAPDRAWRPRRPRRWSHRQNRPIRKP